MKVKFKHWNCKAVGAKYHGNGKAIILYEIMDNGRTDFSTPVATATVNIDTQIPKDSIFVKDYSENSGMAEALIEASIIEPNYNASIKVGFVTVYAFKLTEKAIKALW